MSDFKRLPKSKTSCPLKPWLVDFIFNHDSNQNVTANAVKIIENICEDKNGNMMKLVTDGSVYIKANITHQSIQSCMQENDDDMPPWDKALILMRKYSLSFQPKTELENCEFILIVDEFKLWDLQTGFDFKKTLHPCSYIAKVKMKIREYWQKWRESVVSVNEEPSIGGSMGSQLLYLLAEMGQQTQPEDSQPDVPQSTIDNDNPASKSDAKSSVDSTEFPPVIYGPTLIDDNSSVSESQKLPFLQYIDNDRDISHPKTPESQSQQYEFSSLSEVSLEFSCESSDDSGAEHKMTSKSSKNDSTKQIMNTSVGVAGESSVSVGTDKAEIPGKVVNNVEASGSDDIFLTVGEENSVPCENNIKVVFCGTEKGSKLNENDRVKSKFDSGQLNAKDFLHSYVTYLKTCSSKYDQSTSKQCNNGQNNTDNSMADIPANGCVANDYEKSVGIQTISDIDDKALQDCSESHIYTDLVETDYDSIQWWSSAEDSTCLSDEDGNTSPEKTSEHDKNHTHKTSKSDKNSKNNKSVKQNLEENNSSELNKMSKCTKEPENKNTPERDRLPECNSTSEPVTLDNFTDVEDHVYGTQPFFVNNSEEIMESIGDTTCVELNYKQNVLEIRKHDGENELSVIQPLVSQSERNSDSVSTREPSDEILNSNSNNSNCEIVHKSDSSCYEISEFESKNSSDSTKNIVNPVKLDDVSKSGNLSIIYQSTQKTAGKKEVPLFPISPIRITEQPSTSKDKPSKESVESLVFDTEYEEELRLRELAKADPKTNIKSNEKSTSKCFTNDKSVCENPINEVGTRNGAIQNENVDKSDKSLFNSDKASNSDIFLIQAAQSAEKRFPQEIPEKLINSSKSKNVHTSVTLNPSTISPKPINFEQNEKEIIDEDPKNVDPSQEKNPVQKSISDSNSSESVIIIGSSESTSTNSDESHYSQNVISFHISPRKKPYSPKAKKKTKAKVLAHDTEPYIIDESQDIPTSEVNNSILNRSPKCKSSTPAFPQTDDFVIILSDLSDTSSEEREEPNRQTNHKLKDVLHERLKKRKRKLSSSVEIGEPSSKRTQSIPEQQVVCVDVHASQNENVKKRKTAGIVSDTRRSLNEKVTTTCDKRISLEKCKNVKKSNPSDKQCDNSVRTDNCEHLPSNNYQPRSSNSTSNMEIDQPRSSNSRSNIEIDQPRSSNSRSNMEIDQPRSSNSRFDIEIDQPRSSNSRFNLEIDQPRSSKSRSNMEIHQPRSSSSRSSMENDQPRSGNNRSNMEIDQPRSSNSRSNIKIDQPRSSSRCFKEPSEDRNWWEISDQPSTSKGVRNESRQPECARRYVPQYFEDLFEEEPPSEIQRKLLNYNIPLDKFDCIHKYIHK